jgi:holo-[acyl-carrier protein] synthase
MILGTGSDIVDIRRVERVMKRYGKRFVTRCFTSIEQKKAARRDNPIPTYAKRFAAKEACSKALGTGFRKGVFFRDMGVVNLPSGQPTLELTGGALARLNEITPSGMKPVLHLSLTDEAPWAEAHVIIEAIPA